MPAERLWIGILTAILVVAGCANPETDVPQAYRNVSAEVEFVGDAACASCHEDEYAGFQEHGMANSYYRLTPDNVVETFPGPTVRDPNGGYEYRAIRDGDRFFQEETLRGTTGAVIHRLRREMTSVMGSGTTARTYFDQSQGYLYQLPLTWYTQEERWDFSPGYRVANKRFGRQVPDRCMACHNSYPESVAHTDGKYLEIPEGIGCERCHGPGALHVSERLAVPEPASSVDSTIVNPANLTLDLRLDVCQQCHLHTTVSLLQDGQGAFDFRPSHSLDDYLALFADPTPTGGDEIGVISHAERMQRSACFVETVALGGSFECTTCHDPHGAFRAQGPEYFDSTCQECHSDAALDLMPAHQAAGNCIDCHMPKVEAVEAPHSSFTDHLVRVVDSDREAAGQPSPEALTPYSRMGPDSLTYKGMALVVLGQQRGDPGLARQGADLLDGRAALESLHGEAHFLRGLARLEAGEPGRALEGIQAAVAADPDIPERLNALAQTLEALRGEPIRVDTLYQRAVRIQPARADIWINYGRFLESQNRLAEAVRAYRRATAEQPWLAAGHYNLGTALARMELLEEAQVSLRESVRLEPKNAQYWGNLGGVLGQAALPDSARVAFERAVELAPSSALALGNLGAFHLNQGAYREAIRFLDQAVRFQPGFADALANRALAHYQMGENASALLYARRALEAAPGHALAGQILSALN